MKILCICRSGMGTSMIIKMKANQALKELNLEGSVESIGLGQGKTVAINFDVIFCTQNFVDEILKGKTLVYGINNVMDLNEIKSKILEAKDELNA